MDTSTIAPPPDGFVLDTPKEDSQTIPPPDGFIVDSPTIPDPPKGFLVDGQDLPIEDIGLKNWTTAPLKVLGFGVLSGTVGVSQAVHSGDLQISTNLPDAAKLAVSAVGDWFSGKSDELVDQKLEVALHGSDSVKSQMAKDYLNELRSTLDRLSKDNAQFRDMAKAQGGIHDLPFGFSSNDIGFGVGAVVPQLAAMIPATASATLLGGPITGLRTAAALSGLQTETSVFDDARQSYKQQGLSDTEAEHKAYIPATIAGAITTALTLKFPGGVEAITKTLGGQLAVKGAIRDSLLKSAGKGFLDEAGEEGLDQLSQGIIEKFSYNKDKTWGQVFQEAGIAGVVGGIVGGAVEGGTHLLGSNEVSQDQMNVPKLPTVSEIVDEAGGELLTPEVLRPQTDQALQTLAQEAAQVRPEAARAIQQELDRRNIQMTVELPPDQATEDLNTIPTAEGDLITDFNLQAEQPIGLGEVVSGEDLMQQVQNNEQDLSGQEQVQQPEAGTGSGTQTGQEVPQVSEGPATEAPNRDRIAEGLQDLRPQLVERARRAGVEDPEAVAQDAIIKASTAQTLEEARKFANSTAIQQSVSDAIRKQNAESRQAQGNAVSMQEETPVGTVGESIPGQELAPDEQVQRSEQRAIVESARDEFYQTLSPKEQELWHKIHTPGTGRVPKPSEIQQIAVKFSKFLKDKGHRSFGEGVESKAVPPVGWKPNTSEEIAKLTQDYALDKGLQATLGQIARKSKIPYKRYLARILQRQQGRQIGVVPRAYGKWRPYDGLFGYDKGKPSIILNLTNIKDPDVLENVVLHELIHGQTLDLIDLHRESPELLSDSQRATIEKLNGLLDTARKEILGSDQKVEQFLRDAKADRNYFSQPTARQLYGLSSLEEFVSETMSNAEFIEMLKNIQVAGEGVSMWTKVVEFIKELLEITTPNTAAAAAFEQILALVDEGKRFAQLEGRVPPSRRILTPAMSPAVMSPTAVSTTPTGMTIPDVMKEAMEWGKENLRARGKFNDPIFQEKMAKDQKGASIMNKVDKDVQDLKALLGSGPVSMLRRSARGQAKESVDLPTVTKAMQGDQAAFSVLPESVQEVINSMRSHLDHLSQQLIDSGLLSEELVATVGNNRGVHLNRSYAIFDNPKYKKEALKNPAMAQTIDDARAYLRKYILADHAVGFSKEKAWENRSAYNIQSTQADDPSWQAFEQTQDYQNLLQQGAQDGLDKEVASDNEVEKELFKLLDIAGKEAGSAFAGGVPGRKNRNILKRRKDIPVEIRNLWGEYKDPYVNYVRTASKTASLLTNHRFLQNVAAQGKNEGWLWSEEDPNRPPETVPVVAKDPENKAFNPLAGLYGDEKLREAFQEHAQRGDNSTWVRAFMGLTGMAMAAKTVLSVQSTVRNFMGNILFAVGNGYITPSNIGNLATATKAIEANLTALSSDRKEWQSYVQDMIELGVVGESVSGQNLRELIQRASRSKNEGNMAESMANDMLSKGRSGFVLAGKLYQGVDDFWKIYSFESEKARYKEAYPEWTEAQLDKKAASIVRDVLPTYSLAPQIIQKLKKFPFIAPFITFTSEVVRVAYNTVRIGSEEVKNPQTRKIGISRLVGAATAAILFSSVGMVLKQLLGFDDDDEKSLRQLLPDWQKDSEILLLGKDGKGKISYMDASYLNPYGYLHQPLTALLRAHNPNEALANVISAVFSPIFREQILFGSIMDIARNQTSSGRQVFSPQDSESDKVQKSIAHLWAAFEPGTVTTMKRIQKAATGYVESSGRSYKLGNEIASATLGARISETDANQGLQQAARRFSNDIQDASQIFTSKFKNRGTVTQEEIESAYEASNTARLKVFLNLREAYDAAINLGVPENEARKILSGESLGEKNLGQVLRGIYLPYMASEDAIGQAKSVDAARIETYKRLIEAARANKTLLK